VGVKEVQIVVSGKDMFSNTFRRLAYESQQAGQQINALNSSLRSGFGVGAGIGTGITVVENLISSLDRAGGAGINFNASMEQTEMGFTKMLGSGRAARDMLNQIWQISSKTSFEFPGLKNSVQDLMAWKFSAKESLRYMVAIGDSMAYMGRGEEEIQRIVRALGQMKTKGTVQAEELLQMAEAGLPSFDILIEKLGLTEDQVKNIGKAGIDSKVAIEALIIGMEERFGGSMAMQSKGFFGQMSTFKDYGRALVGQMSEGMFNALRDDLIPKASSFVQRLSEAFKAGGWRGMLKEIIPPQAITMFDGLVTALQVVLGIINLIPAPVRNAALAIIALSVGVNLTRGMLGGFIGTLNILLNNIGPLKNGFGNVVFLLKSLDGTAGTAKAAMSLLFQSFIPFLVGGVIIAGLTGIIYALGKVAEKTRIAKLNIDETNNIADLEAKKKWLDDRIKSREITIANIAKSIENGTADAYAEESIKKLRNELNNYLLQKISVNTKIKDMLNPGGADLEAEMEQFKKEMQDYFKNSSFSFSDTFDFDKFMSESDKKLGSINTLGGLDIPGYDVLQERVNLFSNMIRTLIENGVDPQSDAIVRTVWRLQYFEKAIKDRDAAEKKSTQKVISREEMLSNYYSEMAENTRDAAERVTEEWKAAAEEFEKARKGFWQGQVNQVLGGMPIAQNVIQGATQGAQFGPMGALAGALMPLITSSKTYQTILNNINPLLQNLANAVGMILQPLLPFVTIFTTVLNPIISLFGTLLSNVLLPVFEALFPVIKIFGIILLGVAWGIASVINGVIKAINWLMNSVTWGTWTDLGLIDTGQFAKAIATLTGLTWEEATAMAELNAQTNEALRNVPQIFRINAYRQQATLPQAPLIPGGNQNGFNVTNNNFILDWNAFRGAVGRANSENKSGRNLSGYGLAGAY
jgi:tape measure domain-containing protein